MKNVKSKVVNNVYLHIEPRHTITWDTFEKEYPPFSIALDGFVRGEPRYSIDGPYANFNHHEGVNRLATRSTCAQVLLAIRQGLFESFSQNNKPKINIRVNDCDLDTALAVWILKNYIPNVVKGLDLFTNRLVHYEDLLDVTGGTYNMISSGTIDLLDVAVLYSQNLNSESLNTHIMEYLSWIGEPYNIQRYSGRLNELPSYKMRGVIQQIGKRISSYIIGKGERRNLDMSYEKTVGGTVRGDKKWYMIKEIGHDARQAFFRDNIFAYVSVRENLDGTYTYTLGKLSEFIYFPIIELYDALNEKDGILPDQIDRWGGSDIIGGSPRSKHTKMSPEEVMKVINDRINLLNLKGHKKSKC